MNDIFIEPTLDPHFVVSDLQKAFMRAVAHLRKSRPVNVGLKGPTGCGKTAMGEWFAAMTKSKLFVLDMPTIREAKDLFGYKEIVIHEGHQTIGWHKAAFVEAVSTENAVIVVDEANRIHPSVANGFMPLLDYRRRVFLDDMGEHIQVAPGVVFFLTANIGVEYTGTWKWDAALENRIEFQLEVDYLAPDVEAAVIHNKVGIDKAVAKKLAEVAQVVRQRAKDETDQLGSSISTRQNLAVAELVKQGLSPLDAYEFTVLPTFSEDGGSSSDRANLMTILQGKLA